MTRLRSGSTVAAAALAILATPGCRSSAPKQHDVAIRGMQFDPAIVDVDVGDTIVWTNEDVLPHTATAPGVFDSEQLTSHQQWRYTVKEPGVVPYTCLFHPTMHGTIRAR